MSQKTIFVIDDEEDLRETVEYQLKAKGFHVVTACDGLDGLKKLNSIEPDLIILDMNMPGMNGVEFYKKLKGADEKPKYPILVLTARANMEQLFKDLDVDGFMAKPFELDELVKESERIIRKNSGSLPVRKNSQERRARRICIVENERETLRELAFIFLEAGYIVNSAQSGASAIKRITMDVPDIVLIKLGLNDISGDIAILKLKRNERAKAIKFVLYTPKKGDNIKITQQIGEKEGVDHFFEYQHLEQLLRAVDEVFNEY